MLALLGVLLAIMGFTYSMTKEHERNAKKLISLENYRCRHKSLPDSLTFEIIVKEAPQQLEKLLANNQPEAKASS